MLSHIVGEGRPRDDRDMTAPTFASRHHRPSFHISRTAIGWLPLPLMAIANGVVREAGYTGALGTDNAHRLSSFTLSAMVLGYYAWLDRRWGPTAREALRMGFAWVAIAVSFEFIVGHYVNGTSWSKLLEDYNIFRGRLWPMVLAVIAFGPWLFARKRA